MTVEDRGAAADCDEARRKDRDRSSDRFAGRTAAGPRLNRGLRATASGVRVAGTKVAAGASTAGKATASGVRVAGTGVAAGASTAGRALKDFAGNLNWNTVNIKDRTKYMRAGTRGTPRSADEARRVWESIPKSLRAQGNDEVLKRLRDFDWSHKRPHSQGGGTEASNGIFEAAGLNRSRGARRMTSEEIKNAQKVLSNKAFRAGMRKTVSSARGAALKGSGVACAFAILEYGLEYHKGEITRKEMYKRITSDVSKSALSGVAIAGVMTVIVMTSPGLIPVAAILMKPLAVLGYCTVSVKAIKLGKGWFDELCKSGDSDENSRYAPSEFPLHVPTEFPLQTPSELPVQALSEFLELDEPSSADGEFTEPGNQGDA